MKSRKPAQLTPSVPLSMKYREGEAFVLRISFKKKITRDTNQKTPSLFFKERGFGGELRGASAIHSK
jgi:hypothetical protein